MKPVQKQFHASPSFPFSYVYQDTKSTQNELPDHVHDWYEIVYVHRGQGAFLIDRTVYGMRPGDLFLIPGNTIHRALPDADDPVTSTAVFFGPELVAMPSLGESFDYLQSFRWSRSNRSYHIRCGDELRAVIERALNEIDTELRESKTGVRHAVSLLVQRLLLAVGRESYGGPSRPPAASAIHPTWMRDALLYIDQHYANEIGLGELSKRASVSPAHFSRVFKQSTGMNVSAFIAMKRIVKSKELLLETDQTVAQVAAACGFENMPHFHRLFRRIVGRTPSAYRRRPER